MRLKARAFCAEVLWPEAAEGEETGEYPSVEIYQQMGKAAAPLGRTESVIAASVAVFGTHH